MKLIHLSGIYRNKYGSQQVRIAYFQNMQPRLDEQHTTINRFNWSKWHIVRDFTKIDTELIGDLLADGYKLDYKEGLILG